MFARQVVVPVTHPGMHGGARVPRTTGIAARKINRFRAKNKDAKSGVVIGYRRGAPSPPEDGTVRNLHTGQSVWTMKLSWRKEATWTEQKKNIMTDDVSSRLTFNIWLRPRTAPHLNSGDFIAYTCCISLIIGPR